ncbi:integral membrane protein [Colletotrichum kahawae]|uniref:Integral membrane protein n=1 Tax=Colletotrichum kahawae TaxID=34407 RepID=A0AAE0D7C2_COLKA|nr:integral membrane protein [Colletotrichum kahawae]
MPPDETVGPVWLAVSTTLLVLLLVTTALRLWVRVALRNFGWDDATIALAAVFAAVRYAIAAMQLPHGNGRHRVYLSDYDYMMINMYGWYGQLFHFTSMACLKCSICALVLRLNDKKGLRIFIYTIIAGVLVTNMGVVVVLLAECRPAGFWRGSSAQCWPNKIRIYWIYATIAHSVLTDLILSFIPLTLIWKVNIPRRKKILVMCLMSLGLVASAFGITRAAFLGVSNDDLSWTFCIVAIWSNLELFLGIVAANLALSRAVYLYFRGQHKASTKDRSHPSSSAYVNGGGRRDRGKFTSTIIGSNRRLQSSEARSSNSDIPLEPGKMRSVDVRSGEDQTPDYSTSSEQGRTEVLREFGSHVDHP